MKIWYGYGTEHSANLIMLGTFKSVRDAEKTKELIDLLIKHISEEYESDAHDERLSFSDGMMKILKENRLYSLAPNELEQFISSLYITQDANKIEIKTDELEVSALFKILIDRGARIDVYSGHDYPEKTETT
jgi:hypothetical protein